MNVLSRKIWHVTKWKLQLLAIQVIITAGPRFCRVDHTFIAGNKDGGTIGLLHLLKKRLDVEFVVLLLSTFDHGE